MGTEPEREKCRLTELKEEATIDFILRMKSIVVVGVPQPARAGHYVPAYMRTGLPDHPVNPAMTGCWGRCTRPYRPSRAGGGGQCLPKSRLRPPIIGKPSGQAKAIWLQDGVTSPEAEEKARQAGLLVVSDDCILRRHRAWRLKYRVI